VGSRAAWVKPRGFRADLVAAGVAIAQEDEGEEFDLILVW